MTADKVLPSAAALGEFARVLKVQSPVAHASVTPRRIGLDAEGARNGLVRLVLALIELLRELLERQALRRVEAGSLSDVEVERVGTTFMRLSQEMGRLKREFGLEDDDLNLDLGPLGKLL